MHTDAAYRKIAIRGTNGFGLLIAIFDALVDDLRRAAQAERNNDIEARCRATNHAIQIIGILEDRLEYGVGGELADRLRIFYRSLRRTMLQAQIKRSPRLLEDLMTDVLKVRQAWQEADQRHVPSGPEILSVSPQRIPGFPASTEERRDDWFA